jgi:toxin secretion/phage lysis holin
LRVGHPALFIIKNGGLIMKGKDLINTIAAVIGTGCTYLFGGWDTVLIVLVWFMALDYITGVLGGVANKNLSSSVGFKGILKKVTILIVLIVAVLLDRLVNNGTWVFRTLITYYYIANEGISLLENAAKIGLPVPEKLLDILEQLKNKEKEGV